MDEKIIFYSTKCLRCRVLEVKLKQKNISYEECNDVDEMLARGIKAAPALGICKGMSSENGTEVEVLDFNKALSWINSRGN